MERTHRHHGLLVALLVERNGDVEAFRVIVLVRAVVEHEELGTLDLEKRDAVVVDLAVRGPHVEPQATADTHVGLFDRRGEAARTEPLREMLLLRPSTKDEIARCIEHAREHDLPVEGPRPITVSSVCHGPSPFSRPWFRYSLVPAARVGTRPIARSAPPTHAACALPMP